IRVPTTLGESVVEATVARWLKGEGEPVQHGDVLVELETDKVNVEVTAEQDGTLQKIVKPEGEVVGVNDVLGTIGEAQAAATSQAAPARASAPTEAEEPPRQPEEARVTPVEAHQSEEAATGVDGRRSPSPLARRIAAEHNIDLSQVKVDSPHGRVTRDDVMHYLEQQGQPPVAEQVATATAAPAAAPSQTQPPARPAVAPSPASALAPQAGGQPARREERVRLSRRRQTIAQRLVETQRAAAMLTTFNEIDMSAILDVRARRKETFKERHNVSLGFMSFFTKAVIGALKAFPRLNAEIQGNEMLLKYYYDIGIAVGAEEGLVVPVVRDADRKSFAEIEGEIAALAKRVRDNTLTLAELQGGTFTITNGGVFGSLLSTPILNGPQVGILGMHKIEQRPVAIDGQVVIRPMMYVALSYDHRIVDGREAVQFLVRVKELLEDPETLLLEG
ncbi:MAG: 2-oxoglutarate dehydrogenase complex dihydrolipoyllysine-residue succinyltransferase, partial [Ktedonobacteraceae bacterium]|nr:2-oxoglutarate dehydrogenase complex dihydrolipoyllysine-residue succinyltransferase [Ktedonobacteraceae bacterium]